MNFRTAYRNITFQPAKSFAVRLKIKSDEFPGLQIYSLISLSIQVPNGKFSAKTSISILKLAKPYIVNPIRKKEIKKENIGF